VVVEDIRVGRYGQLMAKDGRPCKGHSNFELSHDERSAVIDAYPFS